MTTLPGIVFQLRFTKDDGKTYVYRPEFFYSKEIAEKKAKRLNVDLPGELSRYEVTELSLSWDDDSVIATLLRP